MSRGEERYPARALDCVDYCIYNSKNISIKKVIISDDEKVPIIQKSNFNTDSPPMILRRKAIPIMRKHEQKTKFINFNGVSFPLLILTIIFIILLYRWLL